MAITKPADILNVDLAVRADSLQDDIFQIYKVLQPSAKRAQLKFEELRGGYVNSIWRVSKNASKGETNSVTNSSIEGMKLNTESFNKSLNLLKNGDQTNGNQPNGNKPADKTSDPVGQAASEQNQPPSDLDINTLVFNRLTEYQVMNEVSRHKLCQPVYAKYRNGICYGFAEGVVVSGPLMLTSDFENEMATKLAEFHSIKLDLPNIKFKTHFERMDSQMAPMFEHMISMTDAGIEKISEFPYNVFPKISELLIKEQAIMALLKEVGLGEITFSHNDLNQKNLVWNPQTRTINFIDFEMAMNNYAAFDLGQLFFWFCGHFMESFDGDLFPSPTYRRSFLRTYLSKRKGIELEEDLESVLERLYVRTNLTALFFMLRMVMMTPFFDFQPDLFKNEELAEARTKTKWFCGKYGYSVWRHFDEVNYDMMQEARDYLAKTVHAGIEK